MSKAIQISLSVAGCEKALKDLNRYQKSIVPKLDEICRRLAEIGRQEIISIVSQVRIAEGNSVSSVETIKIENGWKVTMSGEDVYFIEFGTGDGVSAHYDAAVPIYYGSWSEQHAQILVSKNFWYYNHIRFEGTPAYMPMYYAGKAIRENAQRVAEEVFRK